MTNRAPALPQSSSWRGPLVTIGVIWLSAYVYTACLRRSDQVMPRPVIIPVVKVEPQANANQMGLTNARLGFNGAAMTYFCMGTNGADFNSNRAAYLIALNNQAVVESLTAQSCEQRAERSFHLQKAASLVRGALEKTRLWQADSSDASSRARILCVLKTDADSIEDQIKLDL
jgi:hypothetical protein